MTAHDDLLSLVTELKLPILVTFHGANRDIVRVQINRPKQLNCIPPNLHNPFDDFWTFFENSGAFRVAILTGSGRVFCAGADLKAWLNNPEQALDGMRTGFLGISNRSNRKPIIAALNGPSYGGGTETLVNCDLVVALRSATISLPEARRGVVAIAGALPRIGRSLSLQQANELALVAEPISAETAVSWGLVNKIADSIEDLEKIAMNYASKIVQGSPEATYVSLRGVRTGYEKTKLDLIEATEDIICEEYPTLASSENYIEGLLAFSEKRDPKWKSKL